MNPFGQILSLALVVHVVVILFQYTIRGIRGCYRFLREKRIVRKLLAISIIAFATVFVLSLAVVIIQQASSDEFSNIRLLQFLFRRISAFLQGVSWNAEAVSNVSLAIWFSFFAAVATVIHKFSQRVRKISEYKMNSAVV